MKKYLKSKKVWFVIVLSIAVLSGISFVALKSQDKRSLQTDTKTESTITQTEAVTIPIAMAADDNYTYPTIVSITSLVENSSAETNYEIYIMVPGGFAEENKQKLLGLQEKYENRCKINLIDMQDRYKNAYDKGHITTPTYYRLSLSSLLPEIDKIIWLDGDTLIFNDLTELINIDMNNFYYKGFLDNNIDGVAKFGIENDHYICAGVMLINLEKLRQDDMEQKFEKFISENNDKLEQHDQTVINAMCYKNIGVLPAKYGIFNFTNVKSAREHAGILKAKNRYTADEMQEAYENPVILHCVNKPWRKNNVYKENLWWEYAAKTGYLTEIKEKYGIV